MEEKRKVTIEELCIKFKETAKITCGKVRESKNNKLIHWWSEEIRKELKLKKMKWKVYLKDDNNENYKKYKDQRNKVKEYDAKCLRKIILRNIENNKKKRQRKANY